MTSEAADTVVPNSAASRGSRGSTQRSEMPALKAASARSAIASRLARGALGRKPLDRPALAGAPIAQAVVQPVGASLPELELAREHAVPAPMRRARRGIAVAAARLFHGPLEDGAIRHFVALRRRPCGKARAERPAREIGVGF